MEMQTVDNDCVATQHHLSAVDANPTLFFGPLSTTLSDMFARGYHLRAICYKVGRRHQYSEKVHLVKGREKWLVGSVPRSWFSAPKDLLLSDMIRDGKQLFNKASYDVRDPLEQLLLAYPTKRKKTPVMVGNMTLREYVREVLK